MRQDRAVGRCPVLIDDARDDGGDDAPPHGTCRVCQFADVLMLNRYYGWYVDTGDLAAAEAA